MNHLWKMDLTYTTPLVFVIIILTQHGYCNCMGEPLYYVPGFEVRSFKGKKPEALAMDRSFQPEANRLTASHHQILHRVHEPSISSVNDPQKFQDPNITFNDILEAFDEPDNKGFVESQNLRATSPREFDPYAPYPRYGYSERGQQYGSSTNPATGPYHDSAVNVPQLGHSKSKLSLLDPDFTELMKPVTMRASNKIESLINLGLGLLSNSLGDKFELKGLLGLLINGILKPLLSAKGGIKSLISKLAIPLIGLLLINLEFLIAMWWLWEDCPEKSAPHQTLSYPKPYVYNSNYYTPY